MLARIEVQLRRRGTAEAAGNTLSHRKMTLDKETFKVFVRGRELPRFTRQEFAILELLLSHPGRVYSKEEIFEYAWEELHGGDQDAGCAHQQYPQEDKEGDAGGVH